MSRVQVETDSEILKQALISSSMDFAACGMLICDVRNLLHDHFVCSGIMSISLFCNSVARNLARIGLSWDPGEQHVWANLLPEFVKTFVPRDDEKAIEPELA